MKRRKENLVVILTTCWVNCCNRSSRERPLVMATQAKTKMLTCKKINVVRLRTMLSHNLLTVVSDAH